MLVRLEGHFPHAAVGFPTLQWGFPHCSGNVYSHKHWGKEFNNAYQLPQQLRLRQSTLQKQKQCCIKTHVWTLSLQSVGEGGTEENLTLHQSRNDWINYSVSVVLNWEGFCSLGDIWLSQLGAKCYWHLMSRGHRYHQTSYSARNSDPKQRITWSKISIMPRLRYFYCVYIYKSWKWVLEKILS